ncbi:MAG: hypothetical protein AB9891_11100 [Anaerolineaceae bacterium]
MSTHKNSGLSEVNAVRELQELEKKFDLLQHQVHGWCLWPLLRFDAESALVRLPFASKRPFSRFEQALIALNDMPQLFCLNSKRLVVKTYSSARLIEENGRRKDVFFDDLLDGIRDVFRIEGINSRKMFKERNRAKVRASITSLPLEITAGILSLLPGIAPDYSGLAKIISANLSVNPALAGFTPKRIMQKARYFFWGIKIYTWLLKRTRAEHVLIADPGEYLICAAARQLGIPIYELQHGLVGPAYNSFYSWTEYALPFKPKMPLPNAIFLYGTHWKEELAAAGFWKDELRVTGSILLDSYKLKRKTHKSDDCTILFTSQGLDRDRLVTFIHDFESSARKSKFLNFHIFIKMHPIFDGKKSDLVYDLGINPSITILEAIDQPSTFDLLARADIHWSISSACHYDALGMGVPTVILGLKTYESVLPLFEKGYALLARDGQELFDITRNWQAYSVSDEVRDYFYRSGALENARKEIGLA